MKMIEQVLNHNADLWMEKGPVRHTNALQPFQPVLLAVREGEAREKSRASRGLPHSGQAIASSAIRLNNMLTWRPHFSQRYS